MSPPGHVTPIHPQHHPSCPWDVVHLMGKLFHPSCMTAAGWADSRAAKAAAQPLSLDDCLPKSQRLAGERVLASMNPPFPSITHRHPQTGAAKTQSEPSSTGAPYKSFTQ